MRNGCEKNFENNLKNKNKKFKWGFIFFKRKYDPTREKKGKFIQRKEEKCAQTN